MTTHKGRATITDMKSPSSSSFGFFNVQVQEQYPHQWVPFQVAGMHQVASVLPASPTRSPGISILRVDSQELPLSAIICQLLPCHLRPTLPIILYAKG